MVAEVVVIEVAVTAVITGGAVVVVNVKFADVVETLVALAEVTA
jgi:hypothetical protein